VFTDDSHDGVDRGVRKNVVWRHMVIHGRRGVAPHVQCELL